MLDYNERAKCKTAVLVEGVLFKGERINTDLLSKLRWSDKLTALHLLSFRSMSMIRPLTTRSTPTLPVGSMPCYAGHNVTCRSCTATQRRTFPICWP